MYAMYVMLDIVATFSRTHNIFFMENKIFEF